MVCFKGKAVMKKIVKYIFRENSNNYKLLSFLYHWKDKYWQPPRYSNLNDLLAVYSKINKEINFIQVGSNDGITNDPLYPFIQEFSWSGVCIEPLPSNFKKLTDTYKNHSNIHLLNAAIGSGKEEKIYFINPEKADRLGILLPPWYNQLASFNKNLVIADLQGEGKAEVIDEAMISSFSFQKVIDKFYITKVDLLHIDTEGADWLILSSFPFDSITPEVIVFEHNHLKLADYKKANQFLKSRGFKLLRVGTDTFCYHSKLKGAYKIFTKKATYIFH